MLRRPAFVFSYLFAFAALFACSSPSGSQGSSAHGGGARAHADAERLLADVAWLADDAQGGRRAGTEDARRAGAWIEARFQALGLEPAGEHGFRQSFDVALPAADRGGSKLVCGEHAWQGAERVVPAYCSDGASAKGELAFVGYGVENDALEWNDFKKLGLDANDALSGKVAVVVRGAPPKKKAAPAADANANVVAGTDWGISTSTFTKVMNCKRRGAVAVLVVEHPEHAEPLPAFDSAAAKQSSLPVLMLSLDAFRALAPEYCETLDLLLDRPTKGLLAVDAPARTVEVFADVERKKGEAFNVLARVRGKTSARTVVIGAHYDHLGHGGPESMAPGDRSVHNGADDNASGTAALLELARLFESGGTPECDVVFAAWSGEELGLLGSKHWIENPTFDLASVEANLNLDMVGRANAKKLQVLGTGSAAPFEGWLDELAAAHGFELAKNASGSGIGGSDHQPFLERKIPALHFFSGVHADYHKPTDDLERFEAPGAAATCDLALDLVRKLASAGDLVYVEPPKAPAKEGAAATPTRGNGTWFGTVPEYGFEGPGLKLAGTSAGSPAEKAGMRKDDVLIQVGDVRIDTMQDFVYALGLYKPGDTVVAKFLRDGKEESVRVLLATRAKQ
ncbi:MAG: M20/M25/M40 family metallo-hydrolase [Planctomycetes bacterium]|nr:M20/M25/M40 family metallo-hydrolase [Planctomycetota bacterium]